MAKRSRQDAKTDSDQRNEVQDVINRLVSETDAGAKRLLLENLDNEIKEEVVRILSSQTTTPPSAKKIRRTKPARLPEPVGVARSPKTKRKIRSSRIHRKDLKCSTFWLGGLDISASMQVFGVGDKSSPRSVDEFAERGSLDGDEGIMVEQLMKSYELSMPFLAGEVEQCLTADLISTTPAVPLLHWNVGWAKRFSFDTKTQIMAHLYLNWMTTAIWTCFARREIAKTAKLSIARFYLASNGDIPYVMRSLYGGLPPPGPRLLPSAAAASKPVLATILGVGQVAAEGVSESAEQEKLAAVRVLRELYADYLGSRPFRCSDHHAGRCGYCTTVPKHKRNCKLGVCKLSAEQGFGGLDDMKDDHDDLITNIFSWSHSLVDREPQSTKVTVRSKRTCIMCHATGRSKQDDEGALTQNIMHKSSAEILEHCRSISLRLYLVACGLSPWIDMARDQFPVPKSAQNIWSRKRMNEKLCHYSVFHQRHQSVLSGASYATSPSLRRACCDACLEREEDSLVNVQQKIQEHCFVPKSDNDLDKIKRVRCAILELEDLSSDHSSPLLKMLYLDETPTRGSRSHASIQLWLRSCLQAAAFSNTTDVSPVLTGSGATGMHLSECLMRSSLMIYQSRYLSLSLLLAATQSTDSPRLPHCPTHSNCSAQVAPDGAFAQHLYLFHRPVLLDYLSSLCAVATQVREHLILHGSIPTPSKDVRAFAVEGAQKFIIASVIIIMDSADVLLEPPWKPSLLRHLTGETPSLSLMSGSKAGPLLKPTDSCIDVLLDRWSGATTGLDKRDISTIIKVDRSIAINFWGLDALRRLVEIADEEIEDGDEYEDYEELDEDDNPTSSEGDIPSDSCVSKYLNDDIWNFCGLLQPRHRGNLKNSEVDSNVLLGRFMTGCRLVGEKVLHHPMTPKIDVKTLWIRKLLRERLEENWMTSMPGNVDDVPPPSVITVLREFNESYEQFEQNPNPAEVAILREELARLHALQLSLDSASCLQALLHASDKDPRKIP
eukprot:GHVH01012411.1.p1 GENE.GHVH01012411.1~~GHVH01012411.1.p1  ORF type:complete len:1004 (-),score=169.51 GHVH01012411.1:2021-5032(-)